MANERSTDRWVVAFYVAFAVLLAGALILAATGNRDAAVFVAIVAVARKLLTILNAILRDKSPWQLKNA